MHSVFAQARIASSTNITETISSLSSQPLCKLSLRRHVLHCPLTTQRQSAARFFTLVHSVFAQARIALSTYNNTETISSSSSQPLCTLSLRRHLALSTNNIEKISSLSGMESIKILSLGRNLIKKIENLDAVAETLEELWISYNVLTSLVSAGRASTCAPHCIRCSNTTLNKIHTMSGSNASSSRAIQCA